VLLQVSLDTLFIFYPKVPLQVSLDILFIFYRKVLLEMSLDILFIFYRKVLLQLSLDILFIFYRAVIQDSRVFKSQNQRVSLHSRVTLTLDQTVNVHEHDNRELQIRGKIKSYFSASYESLQTVRAGAIILGIYRHKSFNTTPISRPTDANCDRFLFSIYICITLRVSNVKRSSSGVPYRTYNLQFLCLCPDTNTETGGCIYVYSERLLMMSA
jgi:hypothetical protein